MKVLFIVNTFDFFFSHRRELGEALLARGFEVHILAAADNNPQPRDARFKFHVYANAKPTLNPLKEAWSLLSMLAVIRKVRPTIVHLITLKPHLYGLIGARLCGVPVKVVALAGRGNLGSGTVGRRVRLALEFAYKAAMYKCVVGVVVQNTRDYRYAASELKVPSCHIIQTRGSGVDLNEFAVDFDRPKEPLRCVFIGRLLRSKGVCDVIAVARELKESGVQFAIAGEPDPNNADSVSKQVIVDACKELGNLTYLGRVADVASLLKESSVTLFPSYYGEGIPKVLLESAAAGVPVVTTDNPGCAEALLDGKTGFVCNVGDTSCYAQSVLRLLRDANLRREFSMAARELAEKEFGVSRVVALHLNFYESLLDSSSAGSDTGRR